MCGAIKHVVYFKGNVFISQKKKRKKSDKIQNNLVIKKVVNVRLSIFISKSCVLICLFVCTSMSHSPLSGLGTKHWTGYEGINFASLHPTI